MFKYIFFQMEKLLLLKGKEIANDNFLSVKCEDMKAQQHYEKNNVKINANAKSHLNMARWLSVTRY